jgi:hypothetical protein
MACIMMIAYASVWRNNVYSPRLIPAALALGYHTTAKMYHLESLLLT